MMRSGVVHSRYCIKRLHNVMIFIHSRILWRLYATISVASPLLRPIVIEWNRISIIYDSVEIIHESLHSSTHKTIYKRNRALSRSQINFM